MALTDAALNAMSDHLAGLATHLSLHSADPGSSGTNETTAGRVAAGWGASTSGDITATNKQFTGGAPSGPVTHVGLWSAVSGGTFYGSSPISGDAAFNSAGEYTVTSVTVNGAPA